MAEMKDIVKLAVDAYKGRVEKYSTEKSQEVLREALIAANNGSTKLDYRAIRDGKCGELFALIEEILRVAVPENLTNDPLFDALVDFRNLALGDQNLFIAEDTDLFVVAEVADGTQGLRRQRLNQGEYSLSTTMKAVRIYDELNRVLAGRVDMNAMIDRVIASFRAALRADVDSVWDNVTQANLGGAAYFPAAGSYDETALLDVISHVEAASGGKQAVIIGTKKALRHLAPSVQGTDSQSDLYNYGYYGKFYGNPVLMTPQRHKPGTTTFALDDTALTIIAGDEKPIKVVYEGDPIVIPGTPTNNADLTVEYFYGEKYGVGVALAGSNTGIGRYVVTSW